MDYYSITIALQHYNGSFIIIFIMKKEMKTQDYNVEVNK